MFWFHGKTNINENILPFFSVWFQIPSFFFTNKSSNENPFNDGTTRKTRRPRKNLSDTGKLVWQRATDRAKLKVFLLGENSPELEAFYGVCSCLASQARIFVRNKHGYIIHILSSGLDFEKIVKSDLKKKIVSKVIFFVIFLQSNHTHIYLINYIFHL